MAAGSRADRQGTAAAAAIEQLLWPIARYAIRPANDRLENGCNAAHTLPVFGAFQAVDFRRNRPVMSRFGVLLNWMKKQTTAHEETCAVE